ncbi:MAG TPA: aldehyde dehydrogenase [Streptosporangiaceae bacterium]|nr:aldehyde dehydrogenase [Streptosporangiaceae bacterium]
MEDYTRHLVGNEWVRGSGGEYESINPFTRSAWAVHTHASEADVSRAVAAARSAFPAWRQTSGYDRARLILRLADLMERDIDRLAELETRDNGKIVRENKNQIAFAARIYRFFAGLADKLNGETKPLDNYDTVDYTVREPLGVCALITAWNSPLQLLANKLPPALAAGNTAVIKPSEFTGVSTLALGELILEAGFPPGVINVITGAAGTGAALTSHPNIDKISFTGGVETARLIAANAAAHMTPATYELGGKSANIIFPDANLDRAIPGAVSGIFAAAGQTCVAGSRLVVHADLYDEVVEAVAKRAQLVRLGDPMDAQTQMGPLAHSGHLTRVQRAIADALEDGARLVTGGAPPPGLEDTLFMAPTVFADVTSGMRLAQQEVFGPVLAVQRFHTDSEAIEIANGTRYALASGLWSGDITRAHRVAKELRAGTCWINTYRTSAAQAPFGGFRNSGYGRERGTDGILEYTTTKNTMIDLSTAVRDPFVLGR